MEIIWSFKMAVNDYELPENTMEYHIYPSLPSKLTKLGIRQFLIDQIDAYHAHLSKYLVPYIWQNEPFSLKENNDTSKYMVLRSDDWIESWQWCLQFISYVIVFGLYFILTMFTRQAQLNCNFRLNLTIVFILSSFDVVFFSIWQIAIRSFLQCPLYQIGSVSVYLLLVGS